MRSAGLRYFLRAAARWKLARMEKKKRGGDICWLLMAGRARRRITLPLRRFT